MVTNTQNSKASIRAAALRNRQSKSNSFRAEQSELITEHLKSLPLFQGANIVASYNSWPSEPATAELNHLLLERGATLLVPAGGIEPRWRLLGSRSGFYDFEQNDEMATVEREDAEPFPPQILWGAELIIVPALAVDYQGIRLGRGAGWYDRMLEHKKPDATVVSLLFDGEYFSDTLLPSDEHDVPVDYVVTPQAVHKVGPR
jgi:5-formyltetrahydrofolate cyclo-ligase